MTNPNVSEEEIDAAEKLRAKGDLATSLRLTQEMLERVKDSGVRMRLLFGVVTCSTLLERKDVTDQAMRELGTMPAPEILRALANMSRAYAEEQLGRPENALTLLDMNLETGYFERDDFRIHKYQLCLSKGQALLRLLRIKEALDWLDQAHALYPSEETARDETERRIFGWVEPLIQSNRANCLIALDRFDDAFEAASQVMRRTDGDLATFALQQMAESRAWQHRQPEALKLYAELKKRLPCRLVDEDRIQSGIANCIKSLENLGPASKPS
jgi:tetratricopeptide (TPR) repeat protein